MAKVVITLEDERITGIKLTVESNPPFPKGADIARADKLTLAQKAALAAMGYLENLGKART